MNVDNQEALSVLLHRWKLRQVAIVVATWCETRCVPGAPR
jgi:hypothetical protein